MQLPTAAARVTPFHTAPILIPASARTALLRHWLWRWPPCNQDTETRLRSRSTWTPALQALEDDVEKVASLLRGHCELGGTQININILSKEQVLEAHKDPARFPDLIVRVTGFSAYFASLSPELRQFVVDRILSEP